MAAEMCSLLLDGRYVSEGDIPDACRECLEITLDSNRGSGLRNIIGVPHDEDYGQRINQGNPDCDHEMYYWITDVKRREAAQRIIDIAAECDTCQNFRSFTYNAVCKTEN